MKKLYHFLVLLCLMAHAQSFAQCTTSVALLPDRYVHDTTYASLLADTIYGTPGYTYIWNFSDGSSSTGPFVEIPLTESGAEIMYTLTVTDPSSCVSTFTYGDEVMHPHHVVLHCDSFFTPFWSTSYGATDPSPFQLLTVSEANSIVISPLNMWHGYVGESYSPITATYTVNWGNGVSTQTAAPVNDFIYPGYVEHPGYIYGGEYKISGNVVYSIGTLTCPSIDLDPITLRVQGALAPPLITGTTTYCAGGTLHLTASDTTAQFHNMLHCTDTTGYSPVYYTYDWPSPDPDPELPLAGRSTYSFAWMDRNFNVLSHDTVLNLSGLTTADSGMYYFRIAENTVHYHEGLYSVHVNINAIPGVSEILGAPAALCQGATVTLTTPTPGGIWYSNLLVNVTDGVVTGLNAGPAAVIYRLSNSCGYSADTVMIDIIAAPNAGTITGTHNVCIGSPVTLADAVSGGVWTTVTGNASVSGGVVSGVTTGADTVLYTVSNSCGSAVATFPVSINTVPVAEITGGVSALCVGATMTLTSTTPGGTWYSNLPVSVSGGVVTGVSEGPGAVVYNISNSCGSSADTLFVTVAPLANAGVLSGAGSICVGASTTITAGVIGGVWTTATGNASVTGGIVTGTTAGADTVLYTFTNSCGSDVATLPVMVDVVPDADTITGAGSLCMSGTVSLTAGTSGGTWTATNGTVSISASGIVTPITPGTDTIIYVVANSCGADTATAVITVSPLPVAGSIFGIDTVCVGASAILTTSGVGGIWSSSDSAIIDIAGAGLINALAPGNATITYSVTTACGTATASRSIHVLSAAECGAGITSVAGSASIVVYPNPTSGSFNITLPASKNGAIITITDISGRVVKMLNVSGNVASVPVTLVDVTAGTYLIKVEADGEVYRNKVVKW